MEGYDVELLDSPRPWVPNWIRQWEANEFLEKHFKKAEDTEDHLGTELGLPELTKLEEAVKNHVEGVPFVSRSTLRSVGSAENRKRIYGIVTRSPLFKLASLLAIGRVCFVLHRHRSPLWTFARDLLLSCLFGAAKNHISGGKLDNTGRKTESTAHSDTAYSIPPPGDKAGTPNY